MGWKYGIEIRNSEYLVDDYLSVLRAHHVAHEFNAWKRMPALEAQTAHEENYTADFVVSRVLLRAGRTYENAVKEFEPYDRIQDPNDTIRSYQRWSPNHRCLLPSMWRSICG
jgi:hypothetical protein